MTSLTAGSGPQGQKQPVALASDTLSIPVYSCLTIISIALALYFCFWVQVPHASSSAITVIVIASTDRKSMGSKSIARIIGTLIACFAMNVLFANFIQAPWMFLLTFALWMGTCVFVATIAPTPSFAYAATMAGLTIGVVSIQQMTDPADIFKDSIDRFFVVSVGIASVGLVFGLIPSIYHQLFKLPSPRAKALAPKPIALPSQSQGWAKALRGGLATVLVILVGCSFWVLTQWQDGSAMLLIFGILTAQFIQMDKVIMLTIGVLIGLLVSIVSGFLCLFFVLPYVHGFPMLIGVLALFLLPAFIVKSRPILGVIGSLYMSIFISLVGPENNMNYDVSAYLNESLAFVVGVVLAGVVIALILPDSLRFGSRPLKSTQTT